MQMNLRQIEVFRAVMLSNSIVGAAKMLHVSQPAISRLLAHTERRLGLQLFERIKGRLHPTPDAQKLFTQVQVVYEGVQLVNEMAEDLVENREGTLRLAGTPSLCHEVVPKAIASFCRSYPGVRIALQTLSPPKLLDAVLTQQAELGLAFFSEPHSAVNSSLIYPNQIVLAL
ncbi:LysR family transcriptional regulator [Caenimonas soli]|uniref:LysR family transcriptional regulator n=1 Tax=Caenimonas soli TaxID=2735555 RepID=UPI00155660E4|nr:LysR family transcriptional regulator [Caenimonas soli]